MAISKLEGRIVIPTGGWTASFTDTGGTDASAVSLAAAETFYWSSVGSEANDLAAEIAAQLNASVTLNGTYTCTVSAGVGGTGLLNIGCDENFTNTWTSTDLRNLCGFAGNITSTQSATGTLQVEALWLPNCPYNAEVAAIDNNTAGNTIAQTAISMAANGTYRRFVGDTHTRNRIFFETVEKAKVWLSGSPTYTNQTLEEWWDDVVNGSEPWAANPGYLVKFYPDADTDATFQTYSIMSPGNVPATARDSNYDQWWAVEMEVSGT